MCWQGALTISTWSFICPLSEASPAPPCPALPAPLSLPSRLSSHCAESTYPPGRGGSLGAVMTLLQFLRAQCPFLRSGLVSPPPARPTLSCSKQLLPRPQIKTRQDLSSASSPRASTILVKGTPHAGLSSRELGLGFAPSLLVPLVLTCCLRGSLKAEAGLPQQPADHALPS